MPDLRLALAARYPYRLDDVRTADPSVAVYSRLPLGEPQVDDLPGLRVEVAAAGGPFVLYALHVPRPWISGWSPGYQVTPDEHLRILERLGDRVASERAPGGVGASRWSWLGISTPSTAPRTTAHWWPAAV
jgi:hypothetical protein